MLHTERLEDRGAILALDVLEMEREAVDHLAVPQREELHRRAVAVDREPDHVDRADGALVGGLPLGEALDRAQPVAVARRLLVALLGGGLAHRRSSARRIGRVSPERNSITPSMISP